jgi:hypothetical protein
MKNNLRHYISQENDMRIIFESKLATVPTCLEDSQWIVDKLSSSLSPENLHQDGGLKPSEVKAKRDYLKAVHSELEELICVKVELNY